MALHLITADIGVTVQPYSAVLGIAAGGTNASSQTTHGVCFYDGSKLTTNSAFTYDGSATVALTNASAVIVIGGDWTMQRNSGVTYQMNVTGSIIVNDQANTSTTVNRIAIGSSSYLNPAADSSARVWCMNFGAVGQGSSNLTNGWAINGMEGNAGFTGSATCSGANGILTYCYVAGTGTLSAAIACNLIAGSVAGGGAITSYKWLVADMSAPAFSANNQTRVGIQVSGAPDPGAFTGCTSAAIHLTGSSGASRDGIQFDFDKFVYRLSSGVLGTDGDWAVATVGKGLRVKEGPNAKMGNSKLAAGTAVVSTTAVTANSRIFLSNTSPGGAPGWMQVSARVAGTSFTILSSNAGDTSNIDWLILEPA